VGDVSPKGVEGGIRGDWLDFVHDLPDSAFFPKEGERKKKCKEGEKKTWARTIRPLPSGGKEKKKKKGGKRRRQDHRFRFVMPDGS